MIWWYDDNDQLSYNNFSRQADIKLFTNTLSKLTLFRNWQIPYLIKW